MRLNGFHTTAGLALAAKVAAGTKLTVTKVMAGSGTTEASAVQLADTRQTLTVGAATVSGETAFLPVTLAEVNASQSYTLTELGVFAQDPDAGEILYQVFRLSEAYPMTAGGKSVFRFYLRQTMGDGGVTVSCSPAGLLIDEDLAPIREKVMATSLPEKAVTLSPDQLPDYFATLPKLLTENILITLTAGTLTQPLTISGFYGAGHIELNGSSADHVIFQDGIRIENCHVPVFLRRVRFLSPSTHDGCVKGFFAYYIWLQDCVFQGADVQEKTAIYVETCNVTVQGGSITHFQTVLSSVLSASVEVYDVDTSNNVTGAVAFRGGIAMIGGTTDEKLGGITNAKAGGIIISKACALI